VTVAREYLYAEDLTTFLAGKRPELGCCRSLPLTTDFSAFAGSGGRGVESFLAHSVAVRPRFRGTFSGEAGLAQFLVTAGYR
jgi:hypothetical protein